MLCAIWYHLQNIKNIENTHGGVLLLITFSNAKSNSKSKWVFFKIIQIVPNRKKRLILSQRNGRSVTVLNSVIKAPNNHRRCSKNRGVFFLNLKVSLF